MPGRPDVWLINHAAVRAAGLPVVGSHKAGPAGGGQVGDVGDHRNALDAQLVNRLADERVIGRDHRDCIGASAYLEQIGSNRFGGRVVLEQNVWLNNRICASRAGTEKRLGPDLTERPV
ncbi:hypothetical protein [Mesorhizobium sp. L-2-11]|uniref:hypothetical protein n=1 Tax=Mesorhizobium sp. L-2-11 TaxID=2744521 RepID=UPI001FD487C1|nr:hypothetical protein [Mesorhizobium sp. L-2-11]